ncbi:GntR family transcriptional regulator [Shouchella lonarensis]|uniref:DNA-binding transcriptional regulator YhcF, GntR family n=1 Tax=Shouchella lonarensis TaxID=1464122 RepID=A0A1G6GJ85_9BACI|nr:GntR family transcriptional regulator [Shouchella lonarensis]SDB82000.1 DNA-binding transcriptional regulator YhcF, GntR family [Shouchella lonarensis]
MSVQFDPTKAIYAQIADYYYQQICSCALAPGEKLPSVRETAQKLQVNPNTVSRSYLEMDRDGVTFSKRGQGTFVTTDLTVIANLKKTLAKKQMEDCVAYLRKLGYNNEDMVHALKQLLQEEKGT